MFLYYRVQKKADIQSYFFMYQKNSSITMGTW